MESRHLWTAIFESTSRALSGGSQHLQTAGTNEHVLTSSPAALQFEAGHIANVQTPTTNAYKRLQPSKTLLLTRRAPYIRPSSSASSAWINIHSNHPLIPLSLGHPPAEATSGIRHLLFPFADVRKRCFSVSAFASFFQPVLPLKPSYTVPTKQQFFHCHTSQPPTHPSSNVRHRQPRITTPQLSTKARQVQLRQAVGRLQFSYHRVPVTRTALGNQSGRWTVDPYTFLRNEAHLRR